MTSIKHRVVASLLLLLTSSIMGQDVQADALNYSLTNLGASTSFSTDSDGNREVVAADGTRYAFPGSDTTQTWTPAQLTQIGAPIPAGDYNPKDLYSLRMSPISAVSNANGTFVVTANYSINSLDNHGDYMNEVYTFNRNANGSFSPASVLFTQFQYSGTFNQIGLVSLNSNNVLITSISPEIAGISTWRIDTLNTKQLDIQQSQTIVADMLYGDKKVWFDSISQVDNQGRILAEETRHSNGSPQMEYLLTPDGVTSNPIPAPEPTTLVTLGVLSIGLLFHRHRLRRS